MGIRGRGSTADIGLGRYTTLRPIVSTAADEEENDPDKIPKTKTIRISEDLYQKFVNFSERYYNLETYSTILEDLIKSYEFHNQNRSWRDIEGDQSTIIKQYVE